MNNSQNDKLKIIIPIVGEQIMNDYIKVTSQLGDAEYFQISQGVGLINSSESAKNPDLEIEISKIIDNFTSGKVFISCFGDLFFDKFSLKYPHLKILAPGKETINKAQQENKQYVILTIGDADLCEYVREIHDRYASDKNLLYGVEGLGDLEEAAEKVYSSIEKYYEMGITNFIFGCTGFIFFLQEIEDKLKQKNLNVKIFEPNQVIFGLA